METLGGELISARTAAAATEFVRDTSSAFGRAGNRASAPALPSAASSSAPIRARPLVTQNHGHSRDAHTMIGWIFRRFGLARPGHRWLSCVGRGRDHCRARVACAQAAQVSLAKPGGGWNLPRAWVKALGSGGRFHPGVVCGRTRVVRGKTGRHPLTRVAKSQAQVSAASTTNAKVRVTINVSEPLGRYFTRGV